MESYTHAAAYGFYGRHFDQAIFSESASIAGVIYSSTFLYALVSGQIMSNGIWWHWVIFTCFSNRMQSTSRDFKAVMYSNGGVGSLRSFVSVIYGLGDKLEVFSRPHSRVRMIWVNEIYGRVGNVWVDVCGRVEQTFCMFGQYSPKFIWNSYESEV